METYPLMFGSSSSPTQLYSASSLSLPSLADSEAYGGYSTPSKGSGLLRSGSDDRMEMEFSGGSDTIHTRFAPENDDPVKKKGEKKIRSPRYAFQTRSQVDILDDGYRWRKYGQKAVKNNKFPRSYYRCTHPGCRVKKQVQRLTKDEGVIVTTYEGAHSHQIEKSTENFEHILNQMQIYTSL